MHGGQQLRLFNAYYDDYGFQPIFVFDGAGRFVAAVLRPARRPNGREIAAHLRQLIRAIRSHWPRVEILLRGDSHYCAPEVLDFCRARGVDFILGLASTTTLRPGSPRSLLGGASPDHHPRAVHHCPRRSKQRHQASALEEFHDASASWSRVERIIARVEAGPQGCDTRFIVTSLTR